MLVLAVIDAERSGASTPGALVLAVIDAERSGASTPGVLVLAVSWASSFHRQTSRMGHPPNEPRSRLMPEGRGPRRRVLRAGLALSASASRTTKPRSHSHTRVAVGD